MRGGGCIARPKGGLKVEVYLAREGDVPCLVDLWLDMMRDHEGFEPRLRLTSAAGFAYQSYLTLHLRSPKSIVVLAREGGRTAGFCCAYVCQNLPMFLPAEFGYVSDLFVLPDFRRQGAGTALLSRVTEFFRAAGVACAQLQVYRQNESGRAFWEGKGFEPFFDRMWLDLDENDEK